MTRGIDPFAKGMALAWAAAQFTEWLRLNPHSDLDQQSDVFCNFVESGMYISVPFCKENPGEL